MATIAKPGPTGRFLTQAEIDGRDMRNRYRDMPTLRYPAASTLHPFVQIGWLIKVTLYNQWNESAKTWNNAYVGTIFGLRGKKRGFGITFKPTRRRIFRRRIFMPGGVVRFGRTERQDRHDGRTA